MHKNNSLVWERFDTLIEQMTDEDKMLCSYHKYNDLLYRLMYYGW